ncbi:MAG: nucleotide exchange factor GrpE [Bacteroidales bacterium]|nr:nucleotide exchange factor GrpE [Bacteroidales bacterium]
MAKNKNSKEEEKDRQSKAQQSVNIEDKTGDAGDQGEEQFVGETEEDISVSDNNEKDREKEIEPDSDNNEEKEGDAEAKLAELQDKYLRLSAEFDNYRRRTLKERIELTKSAGESILLSLLPVMDDFDRAMNLMEPTPECKAIKDGVDLIYGKMKEFLRQNGVKEIEAMDKDFDTDLHEAVTKIPATDKKKKGKVVDVIQKGYYLNDKIIRYSKVVVGE